jgi:hypothetical protein
MVGRFSKVSQIKVPKWTKSEYRNHLNCHDDQRRFPPLDLAAATDAGLGSANPGIVDLYLPMKLFSGHIYHGSAKLVEHHPRSFIATKTELALEKFGRQATLIGRH